MVDLLALASRSTSHRPSCPKARRAMPRCRPGRRLPGPLPSRCVTLPRTSPTHRSWHREDRRPRRASWGGSPDASGPCHPARPTGEPVGRPRWLGGDLVPCTGSADVDPCRSSEDRTVSRPTPPGGDSRQTRIPGPGRRCALRYGAHLDGRITPGQEVFSNSQGYPQNFPVTPRNRRSSTVHATVHAQGSPQPAARGRRCASAWLT